MQLYRVILLTMLLVALWQLVPEKPNPQPETTCAVTPAEAFALYGGVDAWAAVEDEFHHKTWILSPNLDTQTITVPSGHVAILAFYGEDRMEALYATIYGPTRIDQSQIGLFDSFYFSVSCLQ